MAKQVFLMLIFSMMCIGAKASHLAGGEITYQWIQGNTYQFTLNLYRDCQGINYPASVSLEYQGCGLGGTFLIQQVGAPVLVTPLCSSAVAQSSCNSGTLFSIQRITYSGVFTLPTTCSGWVIGYDDCCRSANNNLNGSTGIYYKAMLNNQSVAFNNSVQFASVASTTIPVNTTTTMGWNAHDPDGDSLVFELKPAWQDQNQQVVYQTPFTFDQPLAASLPTVIDAQTGNLTVTPNTFQSAVVCMKVSEYRNGFLVGYTYRDLQVNVVSSNNALPSMSGINGSAVFNVAVCAGDTLAFTLNASDPDTSQSTSIVADMVGTNATFFASGNPSSGLFTWVTDSTDISFQPYIFPFTVYDDFCNYMGTQSYAITVYVNGCNANNVWPGDANYDGVANVYDVLALGLAFGDTGTVRPNASTQYTPQPASDWLNALPSGINHKHADTDGNGIVDWNDTLAISLNYGLSHPLRLSNSLMMPSADLSITAGMDTVGTSMPVDLYVTLSTPVDSISGLAFRIQLDTALVKINQTVVDYVGSVMGVNGVDLIQVDQVISSSGTIEVGLSRTDHANISGTGQVVRIGIVTTDNVSGKVTLYLDPSDIDGVTAAGNPVVLNPVGTEVLIDPAFTNIQTIQADLAGLVVAPVPSKGLITVAISSETGVPYEILNLHGQEVMSGTLMNGSNVLDIAALQQGCYHLRVQTNHGIVIKKIMKI